MFPRAKFADGLAIIEKLGHSKRLKVMRREWIEDGKPREPSVFNTTTSLEPRASPGGGPPSPSKESEAGLADEDDELDALLNEGLALATRFDVPAAESRMLNTTTSLEPRSSPERGPPSPGKESEVGLSGIDHELVALFEKGADLATRLKFRDPLVKPLALNTTTSLEPPSSPERGPPSPGKESEMGLASEDH